MLGSVKPHRSQTPENSPSGKGRRGKMESRDHTAFQQTARDDLIVEKTSLG